MSSPFEILALAQEACAEGDEEEGEEGDAPPGQMCGLRTFLIALSTVPLLTLLVAALALDHAPFFLMAWATAPLNTLTIAVHWMITTEISEGPTLAEELQLAAFCLVLVAVGCPYVAIQFTWWVGAAVGGWLVALYLVVRLAFKRIRAAARAHQLRAGSLGEFVDSAREASEDVDMRVAARARASSIVDLTSCSVSPWLANRGVAPAAVAVPGRCRDGLRTTPVRAAVRICALASLGPPA